MEPRYESPHHLSDGEFDTPDTTSITPSSSVPNAFGRMMAGGLSANFQRDAIKLFPHSDSSHESSIVTVDLKNGTVVVEWAGSPLLRLKLKSLKCLQMPGTATTLTKSSKG